MSDCLTFNLTTITTLNHSLSPPIFKLTDDALSAILQLIVADTPETNHAGPKSATWIREDKNRPLSTLLSCSQVCRRWRSLTATSPLLWASAVDLDVLTLRPREWVDEFMRLTRQAPLHVYSLYNRTHINARTPGFALPFINEHWPRIRELETILIGSYTRLFDTIHADIPEFKNFFLKQPAPLLESFKAQFAFTEFNSNFSVPVPDSFPFFKGEAPLLRNFECHDLPGILVASCSANLRHLRFAFEPAYHNWKLSHRLPITRSNVFTTLVGASSLESLVIACNFYTMKVGALKNIPDIHLPRLQDLCIREETFLTATEILNRIKPAPGCGLHLDVYPEVVPSTNMNTQFASLETFATSFFNVHHLSHLELCLTRGSFHFSVQCCCTEHEDNPARFYIRNPAGMTLDMLASLSACNYSRIAHLSVQASFPLGPGSSAENIRMEKFFALLSSVVTLETSIYFLNEFLTCQPHASILLPNLQHVLLATTAAGHDISVMCPGWISHGDPCQFKGPLCQFAAHRRDIGAPLTTVDKSRYWISLADQIVPSFKDVHRLLAQTLHIE